MSHRLHYPPGLQVDNVMVGQFSGTLELAALAPCSLIFSLGCRPPRIGQLHCGCACR